MEVTKKKVSELIDEGILFAPIDGNHGEKHPKSSDFVASGIPFILVPDLIDGIVDLHNCNFISEDQAKSLDKGFSITGDVLFTHKATIGKVALVDTKQYPYIILTPQVTYYRIKNKKIIDNEYLFYYFKSSFFQQIFRLHASSGGTRDYLGIVAQQKLPIIYPTLPIQKKIASILSAYDNLIHNNNKRIKILEQMAENLYKEWFVRFRFPGHENTLIENGIPHGWEYKPLFKVASVSYGYTFKSELFCEDSSLKPVVRIRDILDNKTNTYTSEDCDEKYLISKHSILVGMDGIFHMCLWNGSTAYLNQRVVKIDSIEKDICNYLLYFAIRPQVKFWEQTISGTTVAHLGDKHLKKMSVLVPPKELLQVINRQMKAFMEEKNALFVANQNLAKQRDLLLPRLMSRKLAV